MTDQSATARKEAVGETRPPEAAPLSSERHIRNFCEAAIARLADEAIGEIRKCEASGIFSDCVHRTLWDEYCYEVQEGPHDTRLVDFLPSVDDAFGMSIAPFIDAAVDSLPPESRALLNEWLRPELDADDDNDSFQDGSGDSIEARLRELIDERASRRKIAHLGPDRFDEIREREPPDRCLAWDALQEVGSETPDELLSEHADELLSASADLEDFAAALAEAALVEVLDCVEQPGAWIILEGLRDDMESALREGALHFLNEWRFALSDDAEKSEGAA